MAYSQTDLDAIQAVIASGASAAQINGRQVTFRSLAEMRQIETAITAALGVETPATGGVTYIRSKGR